MLIAYALIEGSFSCTMMCGNWSEAAMSTLLKTAPAPASHTFLAARRTTELFERRSSTDAGRGARKISVFVGLRTPWPMRCQRFIVAAAALSAGCKSGARTRGAAVGPGGGVINK